MEDWEQREDWEVEDAKKAHALYLRVMSAIRAGLAEDLSPEDPNYEDVADLCEACFLASPRQRHVPEERIIERILRWPHRHPDLVVFVLGAVENADLSFLENAEECKAELRAAYQMASAWISHISDSKKACAVESTKEQHRKDREL